MKSFLKSKTLWTGIATICTGMGLYFSGEKTLEELIIIAVGIIFSYLRVITNSELYIK